MTGVDHVEAFNDPESGASLWCLAVDPQTNAPGVGEALVRHLHRALSSPEGRSLCGPVGDARQSPKPSRLYEKIGFQPGPGISASSAKTPSTKNSSPFRRSPEEDLNPYARIIIDEARRRGIGAQRCIDVENSYFQLVYRRSRHRMPRIALTELTSAIAMCRCDDKRLTHGVLAKTEGLRVPFQTTPERVADPAALFEDFDALGGQTGPRRAGGNGVSVGIRDPGRTWNEAIEAGTDGMHRMYVIEEMVDGEDLQRSLSSDYEVVAAADPPAAGNHRATAATASRRSSRKYNRRRAAATGGECRLPVDDETRRCLADGRPVRSGQTYCRQGRRGEGPKYGQPAHRGNHPRRHADQLHPKLRADVAVAMRPGPSAFPSPDSI